jgi:hypothetical protein
MRRREIAIFVLLAILAVGCSPDERGIASGGASLPEASPWAPAEAPVTAEPSPSALLRVPLPSGFPMLPGAVAVAMPLDDPGLIGLWESDRLGSAAYDYYRVALPQAGYPIVGLYPGGDVALIRFRAPGGEIWQLVAHGVPDGLVAIEVRLDRP